MQSTQQHETSLVNKIIFPWIFKTFFFWPKCEVEILQKQFSGVRGNRERFCLILLNARKSENKMARMIDEKEIQSLAALGGADGWRKGVGVGEDWKGGSPGEDETRTIW